VIDADVIKKIYPNYKKTICVDFDGTICEWKYPAEGKPLPGVKSAMKIFRELGFRIIISSCRTNKKINPNIYKEQKNIIENYLIKNNIIFDEIDDGENGKVIADFYIDDKAVEFSERTGWAKVIRKILDKIKDE